MKAVFIGDDTEVASFATTSIRLRWPDFTPLVASTPARGLAMAQGQSPDIVLLHAPSTDSMLSQTIHELRRYSAVPLVVMGTEPEQLQIIIALESGADDYVRLPCSLPEFMARVLAVLRRTGVQRFDDGEGPLVKGDLLINPATYEAFLGERRLKLTATEFRLLQILAGNSGRVVSHQTLERTLWGEDWNGNGLVKKYVQRLRSKLRDGSSGPSPIASVHGVGYRFVESNRPHQTPSATSAEALTKQPAPVPPPVNGLPDSNAPRSKENLGVA